MSEEFDHEAKLCFELMGQIGAIRKDVEIEVDKKLKKLFDDGEITGMTTFESIKKLKILKKINLLHGQPIRKGRVTVTCPRKINERAWANIYQIFE